MPAVELKSKTMVGGEEKPESKDQVSCEEKQEHLILWRPRDAGPDAGVLAGKDASFDPRRMDLPSPYKPQQSSLPDMDKAQQQYMAQTNQNLLATLRTFQYNNMLLVQQLQSLHHDNNLYRVSIQHAKENETFLMARIQFLEGVLEKRASPGGSVAGDDVTKGD
jgi:hypothetical protein